MHERDADTDLCLWLTLLFLERQRLRGAVGTKLIIMSATMHTGVMQRYFARRADDGVSIVLPPVIQLSPHQYGVKEYYLNSCELYEKFYRLTKDEARRKAGECERYMVARRNGSFEPDLSTLMCEFICELIVNIHQTSAASTAGRSAASAHSILVFLRGINDIERVEEQLLCVANAPFSIIKLHRSVRTSEQQRVFQPCADPTRRRVILATNIAESSITIKDVSFVIDCCMTKVEQVNAVTGIYGLTPVWAAQDQCIQRRGRAGRVKDGVCIRLVSKALYDGLRKRTQCELARCPLESTVLRLKRLRSETRIAELLQGFIEPPLKRRTRNAIATLKDVGALRCGDNCGVRRRAAAKSRSGSSCVDDGALTELGSLMESLPVPPRAALVVAYGRVLGMLDSAIILGECIYGG